MDKKCGINLSVYWREQVIYNFEVAIKDASVPLFRAIFTARNLTSFTNNFTKRQIIESSVFSICFPTSEYIPQIPNFPCENSRKIESLLSVFLHFIYWDGSAHSLFPRQIVVVLHKGRADPLAEISFRANGISSA